MAEKRFVTVYEWNFHNLGETEVRVWQRGWPSDMFEVISKEEFDQFQHLANRLRMNLRFEFIEDGEL